MKKPLKITLISLGGLLGLVLIAIAVAVWFVFTPSKLTPAVQSVLDKNIKCESHVEEVELTFFSTFPTFKLKANKVLLKNPIEGSPTDTLVQAENLFASVNPMRLLFDNELIVSDLSLRNGQVNLFANAKGETNFDIFQTDTTKVDTTEFKMPFDYINLDKLSVENIRASYIDQKSGMQAKAGNLDLGVVGEVVKSDGKADLKLVAENLAFAMDSAKLDVQTPKLTLNLKGKKLADIAEGDLDLSVAELYLKSDKEEFVKNQNIRLKSPFRADVEAMQVELFRKSYLEYAGQKINIEGTVAKPSEPINLNLNLKSNNLKIEEVLALLPPSVSKMLDGMIINGKAGLEADVTGELSDSVMPQVLAKIQIANGQYSQKGLPIQLKNINGEVGAEIRLTEGELSKLHLNNVKLQTGSSKITVNGDIDDLMGKMLCSLKLDGQLKFRDFKGFFPDSIKLDGSGNTSLNAKFTIDDISNFRLKKIKANGTILAKEVDFSYGDSTKISLPKANLRLELPTKNSKNTKFSELIAVEVSEAEKADFELVGTLKAKLLSPKMNIGLSDISDSKEPLKVRCDYDLSRLEVSMDTILANVESPKGEVYMTPSVKNKDLTTFAVNILSPKLSANYGKDMDIATDRVLLNGNMTYDANAENVMSQFSPNLSAKIAGINIKTGLMKTPPKVPTLDFDLTPDQLKINQSRIVLQNSDVNLSGIITNIEEYLKNENILIAELNLLSDKVDVNEIMDLVSGFGAKDSTQKAALEEAPKDGTKDPFMVPWNVDLLLNTKVTHGRVSNTDIYDLGGKLMIKDGVLILEQMGFTCEAAEMQLTALYRSERKNHLFAGIDFHLLDIDIDKLIAMVPQIDTIVPMLKYFQGKGEFHLAAETYLKSNYDIKYSTLRGASAIEGKDLVLLDSETFDKLAKMLMFKKKTQNVVDSLSVEMTVFRDEVELFPFLLAMDKYQVVMQGVYNLSQNYKINVETISPIKIGVDLKSSKTGGLKLDKLKLVNLKYGNLFKPEKRNATQQQVIELKKMISDALKANVKEHKKE